MNWLLWKRHVESSFRRELKNEVLKSTAILSFMSKKRGEERRGGRRGEAGEGRGSVVRGRKRT